jgi:hypothetical protein
MELEYMPPLVKSYLTNRKQGVYISQILKEENSPSWGTLTTGVPQGSFPGPLLFLNLYKRLPHGIHHKANLLSMVMIVAI